MHSERPRVMSECVGRYPRYGRRRLHTGKNPKGLCTDHIPTLKRNGLTLGLVLLVAASCTGHPSTLPSTSGNPRSSSSGSTAPRTHFGFDVGGHGVALWDRRID